MELNQIQNPNISPVPPTVKMPMKKNYIILIVILIIAAIGFLVWWYVDQSKVQMPTVSKQPEVNKEAEEDVQLDAQIQQTDLGDLDAEFQPIDSDLNSL